MNLKRNIAVCVACVLLISLGAVMILGGCGAEETPTFSGGTTTAGTAAGTGETTQPDGQQTQPSQGQQGTDPTGSSNPTGSSDPTNPADSTDPSQPAEQTYLTYEEYIALSGDEQYAYCKSFPSLRDFNDWYLAAKKAYDEAQPKETIGPDGNINLN